MSASALSHDSTPRLSRWANNHRKWLFAGPAMAFVGVLIIFPVAWTVYLSLTDAEGSVRADKSFVGLANYADVLSDTTRFWPALLRTVEFTGVGFRYPGAAGDALRDVSFTAHPGELVLVTGPSGAGKSTVSKLLLRFYDPDRGAVRLDGLPLHALPLDFLRGTVALLPQKTLILHDTIAANISCGRPGATAGGLSVRPSRDQGRALSMRA